MGKLPFLLFLSLLALAVLFVVGAAGTLVLQACALDVEPLKRYADCPPPSDLVHEERLAALDVEQTALIARVYALESELAAQQCVATGPDPTRPLLERGWANQALPNLYGCWDVSLDYQTRDVDTDEVAGYSEWQMCFDAKGNGQEIMRDTAGIVCKGPVSGSFEDAGLAILEPDNLACSDGGYIHRREIRCLLAEGGLASCSTLQPETGGAADVVISRRGDNL